MHAANRKRRHSFQASSKAETAADRSAETLDGFFGIKKEVKKITVELSTEQRHIFDRVIENGLNTFFTGAAGMFCDCRAVFDRLSGPFTAGSGKSHLLREIVSALRAKFTGRDEVAVLAPTGMAALKINGESCTRPGHREAPEKNTVIRSNHPFMGVHSA